MDATVFTGNRRRNNLPCTGAAHRADRDRVQPADHRVVGRSLLRRIHRPPRPHHGHRSRALSAIGCGSLAWFAALSAIVAVVGSRVSQRGLRIADAASGLGIMTFGGLLGWRAFHHP